MQFDKSTQLKDEAVFIGDSITANFVGIEKLFPKVQNAGIPAQNSKQISKRFGCEVLVKQPKFVHILAGTNDDIKMKIEKSVSRIIKMALSAQKQGAFVVIGTIPPYDESKFWQAPYALPFNIELKKAAKLNGILVADYYSAMITPEGKQKAELFMDDGIHQNTKGATVMLDVLMRVIPPYPLNNTFIENLLSRYEILKNRILYWDCTR